MVDLTRVIAAYLIPIVLGIVLIVSIAIALGLISRLGNRESDDPAGRALRQRRGGR